MDAIKEDLFLEVPEKPTIIPPIYLPEDPLPLKINLILSQYRRAKSLKNRKEALLMMWYLGEILETATIKKRQLGIQDLTPHYFTVAKRTYYIFEALGLEQVQRTTQTTTTMILKLKHWEFKRLVEESLSIAGARMERGGSC